jgi:NTP pyrophosphatase (non-canonical NTP hydrolase)
MPVKYKRKKVRNYKRKIPEGMGPPKDPRIKTIPKVEPADMSLAKEIPDGPGMMTLNQFQNLSKQFVKFPDTHTITYPALGLASEAGEVAGVVKKAIRDLDETALANLGPALKPELGDVLWYVAILAYNVGLTLEEVAEYNIQKLSDRKTRNVISGSGDNR